MVTLRQSKLPHNRGDGTLPEGIEGDAIGDDHVARPGIGEQVGVGGICSVTL